MVPVRKHPPRCPRVDPARPKTPASEQGRAPAVRFPETGRLGFPPRPRAGILNNSPGGGRIGLREDEEGRGIVRKGSLRRGPRGVSRRTGGTTRGHPSEVQRREHPVPGAGIRGSGRGLLGCGQRRGPGTEAEGLLQPREHRIQAGQTRGGRGTLQAGPRPGSGG